MAKGKKRRRVESIKKSRQLVKYHESLSGRDSLYGRKRQFLNKHGGWGFDYPEPKPWK